MINSAYYSFVNEDSINPDLKCALCLKPYDDPWTHIECDYIFCSSCIEKVQFNCCHCKKGEKTEFFPLKVNPITKLINDLMVKCDFCQKRMKKSEFPIHSKTCLSQCPFCQQKCHIKDFEEHIETCKNEIIICPNSCQKALKRKYQDLHNEECEEHEVLCPYGCSQKLKKIKLDNHCLLCDEKILDCEAKPYGCLEKIKKKDFEAHKKKCEFFLMLNFFDKVEPKIKEYLESLSNDIKAVNNENSVKIYPYATSFITKMKESIKWNKKLTQLKMKNFYGSLKKGSNSKPKSDKLEAAKPEIIAEKEEEFPDVIEIKPENFQEVKPKVIEEKKEAIFN